jgi:hypothetical protein
MNDHLKDFILFFKKNPPYTTNFDYLLVTEINFNYANFLSLVSTTTQQKYCVQNWIP